MPGKNAYPLNILEASGKKHLTNEDKEQRRKSEVKMPTGKIKCPRHVKNNIDAYKKWKEVLPLLKAVDIIKQADTGVLARYCMSWSEYFDLLRMREEVSFIEPFTADEEILVSDDFEFRVGKKSSAAMWKKVEFIFSTQAILNIDKAINQKVQVINSLEDKLFLNPLSRVKNILKNQSKPPEQTPEDELFGSA